ncbi:peptide ABC transporter ATP-binding protein [Aminobacter sp. DSM 101952]|uniref:ATP-binding cassette domain-containing protein n=1 Tax=Aminobacter sp. DSM 101952 TaxID=2735891 RepID=UPI0006F92FC2|nr:ATP-binding cassette domain-containing protein [Aminobacter sp. DSM 101952]KQU75303.1 peptide ABC transporter ATP-binding protein [Aminobacter sp. DSM 101952]
MSALLDVQGLSKRYRRGDSEFAALDGVSFSIASGETLALVGPSGSGKSTVARILLRLVEPDGGGARFDGEDLLALRGAALRAIRPKLQMVFQDPLAAFNPRAAVARLIDDPLRIHGIAGRAARPGAIASLLERVGLAPELAGRRVHEISGGQRQRVAIARAIATRPRLIVLDEAVAALDVLVRGDILRLLKELQAEEGIAYLFISHDLGAVRAIAHRIAIMDGGRVVEQGEARAVIAAPASAIGRALVAATPELPKFRETAS